jgi:hypothetical protein
MLLYAHLLAEQMQRFASDAFSIYMEPLILERHYSLGISM